ncbi:MAG TPA: hypothetical protein DCR44_03680 [Acholeplasmatales bacterium]|nr:MAG: hypothetical protein A2Y16_01310 [Tenericutes bacterium GWF2_57_13]HAQ56484.1 hypothetical protein [Acholeplasmatales bacterium]
MTLADVLVGGFTLLCMGLLAVLFTLAKLAIFRFFNFLIDKKIWMHYGIFHLILIVTFVAATLLFVSADLRTMILTVYTPILVAFFIFEAIWFQRSYFSFESRPKVVIAMAVANVVNFGLGSAFISIFLAFLLLLGYVIQI